MASYTPQSQGNTIISFLIIPGEQSNKRGTMQKCSAKCSLYITAIVTTCRNLSGVTEWAARAEEHTSFTQELNLEVPVSLQVLFVSLLSKGKAECA